MGMSCPACGRIGAPVRADAKGRPVYRCPADACGVLEYDRDLILMRSGVPVVPAAPHRVRPPQFRGHRVR